MSNLHHAFLKNNKITEKQDIANYRNTKEKSNEKAATFSEPSNFSNKYKSNFNNNCENKPRSPLVNGLENSFNKKEDVKETKKEHTSNKSSNINDINTFINIVKSIYSNNTNNNYIHNLNKSDSQANNDLNSNKIMNDSSFISIDSNMINPSGISNKFLNMPNMFNNNINMKTNYANKHDPFNFLKLFGSNDIKDINFVNQKNNYNNIKEASLPLNNLNSNFSNNIGSINSITNIYNNSNEYDRLYLKKKKHQDTPYASNQPNTKANCFNDISFNGNIISNQSSNINHSSVDNISNQITTNNIINHKNNNTNNNNNNIDIDNKLLQLPNCKNNSNNNLNLNPNSFIPESLSDIPYLKSIDFKANIKHKKSVYHKGEIDPKKYFKILSNEIFKDDKENLNDFDNDGSSDQSQESECKETGKITFKVQSFKNQNINTKDELTLLRNKKREASKKFRFKKKVVIKKIVEENIELKEVVHKLICKIKQYEKIINNK